VLLSIWLRIRSIRERIGVAGVANVGEGGHFDSVDGMRPVDRVEVAIGAGGRFKWSPADCVVVCSVVDSSGSVAEESEWGRRGTSGCRVGGAVIVVSVDGGKSRSNFSMFSRICCRMAARSTGSRLGSAVAVEESVGVEEWVSG